VKKVLILAVLAGLLSGCRTGDVRSDSAETVSRTLRAEEASSRTHHSGDGTWVDSLWQTLWDLLFNNY
jgi:hypothetical protein